MQLGGDEHLVSGEPAVPDGAADFGLVAYFVAVSMCR
jgi:hypothetical protein